MTICGKIDIRACNRLWFFAKSFLQWIEGSILEYLLLRPVKPDHFLSSREKRFRDQVMLAVRRKIASERIPCSDIIVSNRPMLTAVRARILRDEWDDISLRRAILIADAVGVDLVPDIIFENAA